VVSGPVTGYYTNFPIVQDPLSEAGIWGYQGRDVGSIWNNVRVVNIAGIGHVAFGTQQDFGTNGFDDSNCLLNKNWGADVVAKATIYINPLLTGTTHEVGLLMRRSTSAGAETGYEFLMNYANGFQIIRWDPPFTPYPQFTSIETAVGSPPAMATGNVLKVSSISNQLKMYMNNTLIATSTDSTYATGRQGMNFFTRPGCPDNDFGFLDYQVRVYDGSFDPATW
jgi:hypothetical protein